jgi:Mg-chelatase subunit ChlD
MKMIGAYGKLGGLGFLWAATLSCSSALQVPAAPAPSPGVAEVAPAPASQRPRVDLVFALDTTGSMGGMIEGAKAKIWDIARKAQEGKPTPDLRVGLVAYRDVGDAYVTKLLPLTSDLDKVYATLTELRAEGGGDTPEHVLKGLHDAVEEMAWADDPRALKLIYLVGDAPPHFDYHDGITLEGVLGAAKQRDIRISAIRCGQAEDTLAAFTRIAVPTDGEVATIEQNGGVVAAAATPYDETLARLNAELAATELHYGSAVEQADAARVVERNMAAPTAAQAERASFYGARSAAKVEGATKKDLTAITPTALAAIPESELPEALRKMSPAERARFVEAQRKKREAILAQVREASAQRAAHLTKAAPSASPRALDTKLYDSLKKAGAHKNFAF